jgi:hypothetical protein
VPTEDALFDTAVDGSAEQATSPPPPPPPEPAPVAQQTEQPLKPDTVAAKPDAGIEGSPADDETEMVPRSRIRGLDKEKRAVEAERDAIRAERDAARRERDRIDFERQEFQRRLTASEKPAAPQPDVPDPLLDPKGYQDYIERRFEDRLVAERREFSLQSARKVYGEEFDQAYNAAKQLVDPALQARMQRSSDCGETLIAWYRELKVRAEVGNDPAAYKKRIIEENRKALLEDPEFRKTAMEAWRDGAPSQTNGRPNIQLAPSLNGVSRSNAALRASQQDLSDDALWETTTT